MIFHQQRRLKNHSRIYLLRALVLTGLENNFVHSEYLVNIQHTCLVNIIYSI